MEKQPTYFEHPTGGNLEEASLEELLTWQPPARIGRYFSGIIHDLNGRLQNAQMQFELLQMSLQSSNPSPDPQQLECRLRELTAEFDRLGEILQFWGQQVDFGESLPNGWVDVNQVLHEALTFMTADPFFKHQVSIEVRLQQGLPRIYGNPLALRHAFGALLENTVDVMRGTEERQLFVVSKKEDEKIKVVIENSGYAPVEGSLDLNNPSLADRCDGVRAQTSVRFHIRLDLYLAHRILNSYGGTINWESQPAKTISTIQLPIQSEITP